MILSCSGSSGKTEQSSLGERNMSWPSSTTGCADWGVEMTIGASRSLTCENCRFAILHDYGYSNYTVEGTEFSCAIDAHPEGSFDRFYGVDERLGYAERCGDFVAGVAIEIDVEEATLDDLFPDQREIYEKWRLCHEL